MKKMPFWSLKKKQRDLATICSGAAAKTNYLPDWLNATVAVIVQNFINQINGDSSKKNKNDFDLKDLIHKNPIITESPKDHLRISTKIDLQEMAAEELLNTQEQKEKHTTRAKPPMPPTAGAEIPLPESTEAMPPPSVSPEGKILYDIPGSMMLNQQQKCIVRIGENEAVVKDNDQFSPGVKIESVKLSNIMRVDLLDVNEPVKFMIKSISDAEQTYEPGSYSEWIFYVTPLAQGVFPLILKVSLIKMIDGKERRKDIVFEKSVTISSLTGETVLQAGLNVDTPTAAATELKNIAAESTVTESDPPNVFISYAHKDKTYFDIFLSNLSSQCDWKIWTDKNIEIGTDWFESIRQSMQQSDCAVLLISSDFISSAFIKENEFKKFNELKESKPGFIFLPIFLRDCDFTRWKDLSKLQLFVAYGDEYGIADKKGQLIPFAKLCRFDNNGQLLPNDNIDTYFKNLVLKAKTEIVKGRRNVLKP
jgi:hypothetical protein